MTNQFPDREHITQIPLPARILLIEDESLIAETIALALTEEGYHVTVAHNGREALSLILASHSTSPLSSSLQYNIQSESITQPFDLLILDLMLPGINGLDICRMLRQENLNVMILILSARSSETDRVVGLEVGADDYLVKPFGMRELIARVRALLRRQVKTVAAIAPEKPTPDDVPIAFQELELYPQECRFRVRGQEVLLSPKEFRLMEVFMRFPRRVWSRDQLLDQVWGTDFVGESKTVDVHVRWIREKIEVDPSRPVYLITVRGFGYRLGKS